MDRHKRAKRELRAVYAHIPLDLLYAAAVGAPLGLLTAVRAPVEGPFLALRAFNRAARGDREDAATDMRHATIMMKLFVPMAGAGTSVEIGAASLGLMPGLGAVAYLTGFAILGVSYAGYKMIENVTDDIRAARRMVRRHNPEPHI